MMIQPTNDIPEKSEIELVATKKTKSLSNKSNLTYHIGKDKEDSLFVRLWVNSSQGYFSNRYVPLSQIVEILKQQGNEPFSSYVLKDLFSGSVNTPGFFAAILIHEGLLNFAEGKKRKLVYTGKSLTIDKAKPRRTAKKAARKPTAKSTK